MSRAGTLAVALAATVSLAIAGAAGAAVGELSYQGCVSGEEDTLVVHCTLIPDSAPFGDGLGLTAPNRSP